MKIVKRVILLLLLLIIIVGTLVVVRGYDMYKKALEEMPLAEKITEIRKGKNYTTLSEVPKMYIDAVISVEDRRFYEHNGIDIISIGRAIWNDIKSMKFVEGRKYNNSTNC